MADLSSVIELIFKGVDDVSDVASKVSSSLNRMGSEVTGFARPFADAASKVEILTTALAGLTLVLGTKAVAAAADFDSNFRFITTLFESTGAASQKFRGDILEYASTSTQSIDKINQALKTAIGTGIDYKDSIELLGVAEKLAVAQAGDLDRTTLLLVGTLNSYGLGIEDATKLSDQFSVTIRDGAITVDELAQELGRVNAVAAIAGVGFDQVGAAIAVLTAGGFTAEGAITGIREAISDIIKPTKQAAELASSLGLEFSATALKTKGFNGVITESTQATKGNAEQLATLFGSIRGFSAVAALGGEQAAKFAKELEAMKDSSNATDDAFKKMSGSVELNAVRISNAIKIAFIQFGTPLLDEVEHTQLGIAKIFNTLGDSFENGGPLRPITVALERFGQDITNLVDSIARNLPKALEGVDFSPIIVAAGDLGREFKTLFDLFSGGVDLSTVEGLQIVIQKIVNAGASLTEVVTGIVKAFEPFANAAGRASDSFSELDRASKIDFGEFLGSMQAIVAAGPGIGLILIAIGKAGLDMGDALNVVFGGIKIGINALQVGFEVIQLAALNFAAAMERVAAFLTWGDVAEKHRKNVDEITGLIDKTTADALRNSKELQEGWAQATGQSGSATDALREKMDAFGKSQKGLSEAEKNVIAGFNDSINAISRYENAMQDAEKANVKAGDSAKGLQAANKDVFGLSANIAAGEYVDSLGNIVKSYDQVGGATIRATGAFKLHGDAAKKVAEETDNAAKKTDEFKIKMEQIASNERIKNIEFGVKLNIASIEGETKRVEAAFKSIDNTVSDTGKLIGELFDDLSKATSFDKVDIQSQIEKENKRRDQATADQHDLVQAQVELLRAKLERINTGEALIRIDSAGTEPALEALLWELLKKIQIRANSEMQDFLLGVKLAA